MSGCNLRSSALVTTGLLLGICLGGCKKSPETKRMREMLGERTMRILAAPDRVDVFRVPAFQVGMGAQDKLAAHPQEKLAGYHVVPARQQDKAFAERLSRILADDKSYQWNTRKQCIFDPGVAYRVWRGSESVIVLICFHCDEVEITADDPQSDKINILECDPARRPFLSLTKQALADDREIQELKE